HAGPVHAGAAGRRAAHARVAHLPSRARAGRAGPAAGRSAAAARSTPGRRGRCPAATARHAYGRRAAPGRNAAAGAGDAPGGVRGMREKDVVLQLARTLRDALEASGRYRAVLTRNDDSFLRLRERIAIAREDHGDLFISLHANALRLGSMRGAAIYTLSEDGS